MNFIILKRKFITLNKLGNTVKIPVRASLRAKRIVIKIGLKGPELILPGRNPNITLAYEFLLEKESWLRIRLEKLTKQAFIDKAVIPFFGKNYFLQYVDTDYSKVQITEDNIYIYSLPGQQQDVFKRFLKNNLLSEIKELTSIISKEHNLFFTAIKIMDNKSRWGSCTSKGVLSFNWRLIFAPKEVLYYLVVHEMSHIAEMNHSANFWKLVKKIYPDYQIPKLWLKENSHRLHQYLLSSINYNDQFTLHTKMQSELSLK